MKARAALPKSLYTRESLSAAALVLGTKAEVSLASEGKRWRVEIFAKKDAVRLLGELLNESLSFSRRQARVASNRALSAVMISRWLQKGFPPSPADPLEQLEPQVRLDRAEDTSKLLDRARSLK